MATTVLVVEDEDHVRELVAASLELAGFRVREAADGETAVDAAVTDPPDLIVLDVNLPGITGWEVCRRVREHTQAPIIFLTALGDEASTVRGLDLGADDYLAKPFSPAVLTARVQAVLRRASATPPTAVVRVDGLAIHLDSGAVLRDGTPVQLTATEFRILAKLAERLGKVVSSRELIRAVQGYDIPEHEAYRIAKSHVWNIRKKIEPEADRPRYLVSVRGLGYLLAGPSTPRWTPRPTPARRER